jgi:hypothetical protein
MLPYTHGIYSKERASRKSKRKKKKEKKENLKIIENKNVRLQDLPYIMHT